MPRKHDNIFPQRKSILFSCNDWIPTMTTTISSMWSAKVNLQFPTKKFTALKESHDFAFGVRSLSTHRIPVFFGGYEHSTQKRIQQQQQQHVNNNTTNTNTNTNNNNNNNNNINNNSGDRSNSRSHNFFFVSFDTAGLECNDRMRRTDAMIGCHRRYASVNKALLTTDAEDITCGQKRHTRNSGSTWCNERMQRTDATSWANALKGVVITELQISCKQSQDEWTEQTHNLLISQKNVVLHCLNIFEMKRHIYSTHPDLLGVDTCGQKRHTRYPVKLNYLSGATDSKELLQDWELVLCDVSSNTSQRTSSQSSHNWNEPMKHSSHWSPQILGTLPLDKIRDMSLRHLCTQRNTRANVAALPGYKDRRAFGFSRRMQAQTTNSSQTSICFVSWLLFVLAAFCCRKSFDLASLPCRSNRWLWIGAPQLSHLRFKDWQSAGVSSWTTPEWNPVKVHDRIPFSGCPTSSGPEAFHDVAASEAEEIYFFYLACALAVRRDTQGNQWNKQTWSTRCNDRMRRTDAMMGCNDVHTYVDTSQQWSKKHKSIFQRKHHTYSSWSYRRDSCDQKRHTRNSVNVSYLSGWCFHERMLQVGLQWCPGAEKAQTCWPAVFEVFQDVVPSQAEALSWHKVFEHSQGTWSALPTNKWTTMSEGCAFGGAVATRPMCCRNRTFGFYSTVGVLQLLRNLEPLSRSKTMRPRNSGST